MKSDLVDIEVLLVHETGAAFKVALGDPAAYKAVWVPKSACELEKASGVPGRTGWYILTLRETLAIEKGLV